MARLLQGFVFQHSYNSDRQKKIFDLEDLEIQIPLKEFFCVFQLKEE